ncbi:MAG: winged helix-turn-helix transcriptional regulator [Leptospiraceae bacterium]|nr:winged helix-turn-helix transcriptional regulator [Leptospiraceae bacterium]
MKKAGAFEVAYPVDRTKLKRVGITCVSFNLRKASRLVTRHYDERMEPSGLRSTQFAILAAIGRRKGISLSALADLLVMDRTTLTRNLKPLEKMGYVGFAAPTDRRRRELELTPVGWEALGKAYPYWESAQTEFLKEIGEENSRGLLKNIWRFMYGKRFLDA